MNLEMGPRGEANLSGFMARRAMRDLSEAAGSFDVGFAQEYAALTAELLSGSADIHQGIINLNLITTRATASAIVPTDLENDPMLLSGMKGVEKAIADSITEDDAQKSFETLLRTREKALELAAQKGIHPGQMFETDELYSELLRAVHADLPKYVTDSLDVQERDAKTFFEVMVETMVKDTLAREGVNSPLMEGLLRNVVEEQFRGESSRMKAGRLAKYRDFVKKHWGEEEYRKLPFEIQARLDGFR